MKKSLKRLIENSPTSFFESVKERLVEKATDKIGSVAGAVAPSIFEEETIEEDVEELNELSKRTLNSYVSKAHKSRDKIESNYYSGKNRDGHAENSRKFMNRERGIANATFRTDPDEVDETGDEKFDRKMREKIKAKRLAAKNKKGFFSRIKSKLGMKEEVEHVEEDMGAHTIYTRNKKTGQNVATFVVNKKRRGKADIAKKWQELVKKNQPKETAWDKHVKDN